MSANNNNPSGNNTHNHSSKNESPVPSQTPSPNSVSTPSQEEMTLSGNVPRTDPSSPNEICGDARVTDQSMTNQNDGSTSSDVGADSNQRESGQNSSHLTRTTHPALSMEQGDSDIIQNSDKVGSLLKAPKFVCTKYANKIKR